MSDLRRHPGTLVSMRWHFAWLPCWSHDEGWLWFSPYQIIVLRSPAGRRVRRVLGLWLNWYTQSWGLAAACRGDGLRWIRQEAGNG